MSLILDGTTGVTTPTGTGDVSVGDDLIFTGTGNRITGDFSNATVANRVLLQSSTTNGQTAVGAMPNGTSTQAQFIAFNGTDPSNSAYVQALISSTDGRFQSGQLGTATALPMTFYTGGSERVRIDTSGNVGIGTSSPGAKFDVNGTTRLQDDVRMNILKKLYLYEISGTNAAIITSDGSGNIQMQAGTAGVANRLTVLAGGDVQIPTVSATLQLKTGSTNFDISAQPGANDFLRINANGTQRFQFNSSGQAYNSTGTWGTISDARLKENIANATPKLNGLMQLRVVNYNLKADPDVKQLGFIAQEVEQVFPGLVEGLEDDGEGGHYKAIKTTVLIPMLVKAIQEQQAIITALTARVEALEGAQA